MEWTHRCMCFGDVRLPLILKEFDENRQDGRNDVPFIYNISCTRTGTAFVISIALVTVFHNRT